MVSCVAFACLAQCAAALTLGTPINFWLLRQEGVVSADEDRLVSAYISSLRVGDSDAEEKALAALTARTIAVEFEPSCHSASTSVVELVELSDGVLAEEIGVDGPRTFMMPGSRVARVDQVEYAAGGLGARAWDASVGLGIYLSQNTRFVLGKSVLELGSGVGLGGISAALVGASTVMLTDVTEGETERRELAELGGAALMQNLVANARLNDVETATATRILDWFDCLADDFEPHAKYQVVIGADLVHDEKYSLPALAAAVATHTAPNGIALLMNGQGRPGVNALPAALQRYGGTVQVEEMTVMHSYGSAGVLLTTYRPGSSDRPT
uniref:Calmodulin-lysine N-methyltransferase n=1 Tax=Coccolithus braarudii TaxID=221442 RepID=A0A7S0Q1V5_9EUKA|mmetsp:Transcript_24368/g.52566  ORF Transcript_24368/g.52566 Transcript_24368/m.52566 type:complete len:326 (+) Transcript_24368:76-1053(+)